MTDTSGGRWKWVRWWPRLVGAILLAAAAQCGLGVWLLRDGADEVSRACLYYLCGCAAMSGTIGLVLCLAPLPLGKEQR
jgi:hypothetical protein